MKDLLNFESFLFWGILVVCIVFLCRIVVSVIVDLVKFSEVCYLFMEYLN